MSFVDQALSLINKTEANLRRIDAFGEDFAIPSLNEWRYATIAGVLFSIVSKIGNLFVR